MNSYCINFFGLTTVEVAANPRTIPGSIRGKDGDSNSCTYMSPAGDNQQPILAQGRAIHAANCFGLCLRYLNKRKSCLPKQVSAPDLRGHHNLDQSRSKPSKQISYSQLNLFAFHSFKHTSVMFPSDRLSLETRLRKLPQHGRSLRRPRHPHLSEPPRPAWPSEPARALWALASALSLASRSELISARQEVKITASLSPFPSDSLINHYPAKPY
ncbi:hypothetical protein L1887_55564 [Cichorium endivia]|nr:hypothetical protein L1887_55564 [Cichorium endivia]